VRLLRAPGNVGFSAANNIAFRESGSELVLLLNPDTIVPAGAIDRLVEVLLCDPAAAVVGPRLVGGDGRAELSFGPMPSPWGEMWQRSLGRLHQRGAWPVHQWVDSRTRRARTVAWVSGACLLVRRADAVAVGLLDERFFLYWEDVDFCAALRARGRHIRFTPAVEVTHLRGRSSVDAGAATALAYRRGQLAFYRKWRPLWAPVLASYLRVRGRHPHAPGEVPRGAS
jgi:GT2 family glycosyltransferase